MRFLTRSRKRPASRVRSRRRPLPEWVGPARRWLAVGGLVLAAGTGIGWVAHSGHAERTWAAAMAFAERATGEAGLVVNDVLVTGRTNTDPEHLLAALDVARGTPILWIDLDRIHRRVLALPWVKAGRIERRLPDTLFVELQERVPLALWQRDGRLTLVDIDGEEILRDDIGPFAGLPIVIGEKAPERAHGALQMLASQPDLLRRVKALTWVGERRWTVRLEDGIEVQLPEAGAEAAWAQLAALERDHGVLGRDVMTIDLRIPDQLIVRVTPDASVRRPAPGEDT